MSTLATRLQIAFDPTKHRLVDLAKAAGVRQPSVSDWFSGETISLKAVPLVRAAKYLGVSALWLATGEGRMRDGEHNTTGPVHLAQEPQASYHWPFAKIDQRTYLALPIDTRGMLEGAFILTARQLGVDLLKPG